MDPVVPVLMYHQLAERPDGNKYTLTRSMFQTQMECLNQLGLQGVSVGEFLSGRRQGVVVLTFDDGNRSDAEYAWPILQDLGFSATFFVTAGQISEHRLRISWRQLRDLAQSGAEIGCHGRTHRFLDTSEADVLGYEIAGARKLLEDGLGVAVDHFSLPGGRYNADTLRVCAGSGFISVARSTPGYGAIKDRRGPVVLDRFVIHRGQSRRYLRQVIEGNQLRANLDRLAYHAKRGINRLMGNRLYQRWWNIYMTRRRPWPKSSFG
jgi:peptidoglycan/xylan/chitin deacetylase (PgdA/CDA1 family)